jgi:hypothetical protein
MATEITVGTGKQKFKLFRKNGNKRLIISAHGGKLQDTKFDCPGGVWRTSVYGLCTTSQVQDIVDYRNHKGPKGSEGNVWQFCPIPSKQTNWTLARFASPGGSKTKPDTFKNYLHLADTEGFDIISPLGRTTVGQVMGAIPNRDRYQEIWFSFCLEIVRR